MNGIQYSVRNTGRKRSVTIRIDSGGAVSIIKSPRVSLQSVTEIIRRKFEWIQEKVREQMNRPTRLLESRSEQDYRANKENARRLVQSRLEFFNAHYGFTIGRVSIRNQKSRWGSCSRKGNLNFTYKLVHIAPELADYVVIHELCHIGELNHGPRFWKLVAETCPDYKARRKALKNL